MKMSGTRQIDAAQAEVWAKLNDVDVLKRCIPGCESLEKTAENELKSTVAVKIGPMNVRFNGNVTLSDLDPPNAYRISGKGQGGAAGFASGGANVKLARQDGGTLLSYDVDATVGGKIAQLGARLIDATAASLANQFFDRFAAEMAPVVGSTSPAAATSAPAAATDRSAQPQREVTMPTGASRTGSTWLWWAGAVVVAIIIYFLLRR